MNRSRAVRCAAVRDLVDAAQRLKDKRAELIGPLTATTGLSPEGVDLGFEKHLEADADDDAIARLVDQTAQTESVHVVLSANVFVAPLRALAIAIAAAPSVTVRPSAREPVFTEALVREAGRKEISLARERAIDGLESGELHVYGRDETIAALRARAARGVRVRGHGAGMGVALLSEHAALDAAAAALAADVVPFDQRGCLSPRVALVCGDEARARGFAEALFAALAAFAASVPRGAIDASERAEAARYVEAMRCLGHVYHASSHAVAVARSFAIPPPGRHVHVVPVADVDAARALLRPIERVVVSIGCDDPGLFSRLGIPHARVAALGAMQRPPLDGPVDRRPDGA